jgi:hypothetical protein
VVGFAGAQTPHDWTFTTEGFSADSQLTLVGHTLHFSSRSPAPIRVTFRRATGGRARTVKLYPGHRYPVHLDPGSWQACGRQRAIHRFAPYVQCLSILVTGVPKLRFGRPGVEQQQVAFPLTFSRVLRGRTAMLTTTPLTVTCTAGRCTNSAGTPTTRTIVLRPGGIMVPLPAKGHGVQLTLATEAFQLRDAPWIAARASSKPFVRR